MLYHPISLTQRLSRYSSLLVQRLTLTGLLLLLSFPMLAQDVDPPVYQSATQPESDPTGIMLTFSEELQPGSIPNLNNYLVTPPPVGIVTAHLVSTNKVRLVTGAALAPGVGYAVTVRNLLDLAGNVVEAQSLPLIRAQGAITLKTFSGIFGATVDSLLADLSFPDLPSDTSYPVAGESVSSEAIVGYQMIGYVHAPSSGDFTFFISGDNTATRLFLSGDDDPANKVELIPSGSAGFRAFTFGTVASLVEGQKYYIEALAKRQWGGGSFSLGWQGPTWLEPQVIGGEFLSSISPSGPITITEQPQSVTASVGSLAQFSVSASGTPPYRYQWRRNGTPIIGATDRTLRIPFVSNEDAGNYTVEVRNASSSQVSTPAVLTVEGSGGAGPHPVAAASFAGGSIGIQFDATLDPASAGTAVNYQIFGGGGTYNVTGVTLRSDQRSVLVAFTGDPLPDPFTVKVQNLKTSQGVAMTEPNLVLGSRLDLELDDIGNPIEAGSAVSTKAGSVEVIAGGLRTWDVSDSFNYIHAERTGDFDVRVRVDSVEQLGAPGGDPKAALMARADLTPGSPNVSLNVVSTRGYIEYLYRPTQDGQTTEFNPSTSPGLAFPQWIRLQREGDTFRSYRSADGATWTVISEGSVPMPATILVGLNTNPDINQAGARLKVQYSNFSLAPADQGFEATDIGDPIEPGQVAFGMEPGEVQVIAGGLRTWDTSDSFNFVHKQYSGDFDVKVRVNSVTQNGAPGGDPKAALMARANLTPGSPNVSLNVVSTRGYIEYLYRPAQDAGTTEFNPSTSPGLTFPQWIRLRRSGNTFTSYRSIDGANWTTISFGDVDMPADIYVGLNTNPDINQAGSTLSVSYSGLGNVSAKITLADQGLTATDIGAPIEPGYVTTPDGWGDIDVVAGGLRTWDTSDSFTYVHEPKEGDFDVRVRVDRVQQLGDPGSDPKAALMARANLTAGSPNVSLNIVATRGYIEYLYRPTQDGGTTEFNPSTSPGLVFPQWIRLQRVGNTFTSYRSSNGDVWTLISAGDVDMPSSIFLGLNTNADRDQAGSRLYVQYRDYGPVPTSRPSPILRIVRNATQVVLSWPEADTGFVLDGKGNLADPTWNLISSNPSVSNGRFTVTVPIVSGANAFFRLRQP